MDLLMTSKLSVNSKGLRMPIAEEAATAGLKQCQQAQDQLEDAINGVMKAEQQLKENTREVRAELQSCISRQQEALRCREVCLLGQIELLEQLKTETLQQQLHQLHRLRGQFDVIMYQLQNSNGSNDLNNQLTSCLEKLSSISLTPEETPEMSFHADTRSLRSAITSFGRVASQGMSSRSPALQKAQEMSSPISVKRQKMDAVALDEWLLGTPQTSSTPIGYQSSKNPQDWLMALKESKTPSPIQPSMDFLKAWGQLKDLKAWLLHDNAPISRERAESSCSSLFSIEKIEESDLAVSEGEEEEEELSDWLITPTTLAMETMSDAERWRQVFKPFEDSWSSSDWLLKSSHVADCSSCCQTTKAVEIENLGQLKCLKTPPISPTNPATPPSALEAWLQHVVPLEQNCKANEVCSTYSDCVCDNNCGREALNLWLVRQDGRDKNGVPVQNSPPTSKNTSPTAKNAPLNLHHMEQERKVQAILEAWLHPSSSSSCKTPLLTSSLAGWVAPEKAIKEVHRSCTSSISTSSMFQQTLDPDLWVLPGGKCPPALVTGDQPRPSAEEEKWLLKKRNQAQERLALPTVCDLFSCMKVGGDKEKWLHKSPEQM